MKTRLDFRFELPPAPAGAVVELSAAEAERLLLRALEDEKDDPTKALWQLAQFYKVNQQHEKALEHLRKLLACLPDLEDKANCVFTMGQAMENAGDYPAAIRYYKEAFAFEPTSDFVWYFINNNLGYCLNTQENFSEGERYCRKAIEIDPQRPNGYKNLGIAFVGQGRFREAARAFVNATQANAADGRALSLLEKLLHQHSDLRDEFHQELQACRQAVDLVARKANAVKPVVYRGWRKRFVLLRMRLLSWWRRRFRRQ